MRLFFGKPASTAALCALTLICCTRVPITGRKQLGLIPESTMIAMADTNYRSFLSQNPPAAEGEANTQLVKKVGKSIAQSVETYMKSHGLSKQLEGYSWEFNLVKQNEVNAWCMPGGKVVVYTGLLPVTQNETALAVVMGHEIAHAIARHGNERMSGQLLTQLGGMALSVAVQTKPQVTQNIFLQSYGVTSTLGMLAYSRNQESEADKLGLVFMAMAGYDPTEAIAFWERMAAASGGNKPPELLSTHPSDETRIKDIKAFLPEALKFYTKK